MNTYGFFAVNRNTFNIQPGSPLFYPKEVRDPLITYLKVSNLVLNTLGYMPKTSLFSGCLRMGTGFLMFAVTAAVGERNANSGAIIGRWYDEALLTGVSQIFRGIIEAFVPYGRAINLSLDSLATMYNVARIIYTKYYPYETFGMEEVPHQNPRYPIYLNFLYLV